MSRNITVEVHWLGTILLLAVIALLLWAAWSLIGGILGLTVRDLVVCALVYFIGYAIGKSQ